MNHQKEIDKIKESIKSGALCAINRDIIDTLSIYGFPVEMSDTLAARRVCVRLYAGRVQDCAHV